MSGHGHVLEVFQPPIGGVPVYVGGLVDGLLKRGWRVTVAAPDGAVGLDALSDAGAEIVTIDVGRSPSPAADARAVARLRRLCRERDVDLLHGHSSKAGILTATTGRLTRLPSVYTPHAWSFEMQGALPKRMAFAAVETLLARRGHAKILTVAAAEREAALRWKVCREEQISVVHTGIRQTQGPADGAERAAARELLGLPDRSLIAAWVGRLAPQKRPQDLPDLQRRLPGSATVVALGDGLDGTPEAGALVAEGGIVADSETDAETLYAAADVLVQTSAWEGLPLSVLEAMDAGLPVVAYDVGGVAEQVDHAHTGFLVDVEDVDALAAHVGDLAEEPDQVRRMGEAGRMRVEHVFSYSRMLDRIEATYASVRTPSTVMVRPNPAVAVASASDTAER